MGKKLLAFAVLFIFVAALTFSVLPPSGSADTSGICFLAVNDSLKDLSLAPAFIGGITFVPASALADFGIYTTSFSDNSTVSLYTASAQLYFNMSTGGCYDGAGNEFSVSAVYRGGLVYVPAVFVCNFFGVSCTYISGIGYGDIVRLNNGVAVLSDSSFLDAATSSMRVRYNEYIGADPITSTPRPSPGSSPSPSPSPPPDKGDTAVFLSFIGLPDEALLSVLSGASVRACFFLTAEDVSGNPDMVRRLIALGQRIGVLCGDEPEADFAEASDLIYEACRIRPMFVASVSEPAACQGMADKNSLIFWHYTISGDGDIAADIADSESRADVRLEASVQTSETLLSLLTYLRYNKFDLRVFSETETPCRFVQP